MKRDDAGMVHITRGMLLKAISMCRRRGSGPKNGRFPATCRMVAVDCLGSFELGSFSTEDGSVAQFYSVMGSMVDVCKKRQIALLGIQILPFDE